MFFTIFCDSLFSTRKFFFIIKSALGFILGNAEMCNRVKKTSITITITIIFKNKNTITITITINFQKLKFRLRLQLCNRLGNQRVID